MKKFNPKLIMIDVDGTLVDSVPDLAYCVDELMATMGREKWGEAKVRHWVGNGVPKLVERSLTGELEGTVNQADFDKAYPIFLDLYAENTSGRSSLYPGVQEGLDYMKAQGYTLGCVTNKAKQFTLPILKDLGIFDYFGIVVSGDTLAKKKPDPLPLLHSAEFFGIDPKDSMMLGDSISDVKASRAAGFDIICMSYGYNHGNDIRDANPDVVIDSMAELTKYLERTSMDAFDNQHIWHPYAKVPNHIPTHLVESAEGVYLTLASGKQVIDGMSSWWSAIHGYNHPVLNQAVNEQLKKMSHVMFGGLTHQPAIDLAKTLVNITPDNLTKVFFSDSGSISVEVALKMALQYWHNKKQPNKQKIITIRGGYHGDSFGAMSVCDPDNGMHHLFKGILTQQYFVKSPSMVVMDEALADLETTLKENSDSIAAMILEPVVQGAGGMRIYNPQYLTKAKALCKQYKALFILDEIATGFGRTGELFALEYVDVEPDILCLGKALTGGYMTLAATLTSDEIANTVGTLMHGPTFMANPLACAVANASIELLLNEPWQDNIARIEKHFYTHLSPLSQNEKVASVRILGAIGVVEMVDEIEVEKVQNQLIENGVWLRPYGKLLYTMPPFVISDDELSILTQTIKKIVEQR